MSLRLTLLRHLPAVAVRGYLLDRLAKATAEAFGAPAPERKALPFAGRLAAYAEFTTARAAVVQRGSDTSSSASTPGVPPPAPEEVGERLYRNAESLGADFRRLLGIKGPGEAFEALQFLYRQIGIEISSHEETADPGTRAGFGAGTGEGAGIDRAPSGIGVTRCFFSNFYSPDTCRLMSAFDAGVVAGLFRGARLEFSERITEGAGCCRALIRAAEGRA